MVRIFGHVLGRGFSLSDFFFILNFMNSIYWFMEREFKENQYLLRGKEFFFPPSSFSAKLAEFDPFPLPKSFVLFHETIGEKQGSMLEFYIPYI